MKTETIASLRAARRAFGAISKYLVYAVAFHASAIIIPILELFFRQFFQNQNLVQRTFTFVEYNNSTHFFKISFFLIFCGLLTAAHIINIRLKTVASLVRLEGASEWLRLAVVFATLVALSTYGIALALILLDGYSFQRASLSFILGLSFLTGHCFFAWRKLSPSNIIINGLIIAVIFLIIVLPLSPLKVLNLEGTTVTDDIPSVFLDTAKAKYGDRQDYSERDFTEFYSRLVNPAASLRGQSRGVIFEAQLTPEQIELISRNLTRPENLDRSPTTFIRPVLVGDQLTLRLDGENLRSLCFLADYGQARDLTVLTRPTDFKSCTASVARYINGTSSDRYSLIERLVNERFHNTASSALSLVMENEERIEKIAVKYRLTQADLGALSGYRLSATRGSYFHHYHSALTGVLNYDRSQELPWTQYGLGISYLVLLIKKVSGITAFDSLVVAVLLTNFTLAVTLIWLERNTLRTELSLPLFGFLACLGTVYFSSEMIAPALYPVRVLPQLLLVLYLLYGMKTESPRTRDWAVMAILIPLGFIYNFEFSVLLVLALISSTIVSAPIRSAMKLFAFALICATLILIVPKPVSGNAGSYFIGIGIPPLTGRLETLALIFSVVIAVLLLVLPNKYKKMNSFAATTLVLFFVFSSIKFWWNSSLNHFGLPIFFLFLAIASREKLTSSRDDLEFSPKASNAVVLLLSFGVAAFALAKSFINYSTFLGDVAVRDYVQSPVTKFRMVDKVFADVERDLEPRLVDVTSEGKLNVVGPYEWYLSLRFKLPLNSPYPDFNTASMIEGSLEKMRLNFDSSRANTIAVDRALMVNRMYWLPVSSAYSQIPFGAHLGLSDGLLELRNLAANLLHDGAYVECGQSRFFVFLCRKN